MSTTKRFHGLRPRRQPSIRLILENLEHRVLLASSSVVLPIAIHAHTPGTSLPSSTPGPGGGILPLDGGSPLPIGYTPDQILTAYGIKNILFGKIAGDGTGQTIAIVDAYDDPAFVDSTLNGQPNPAFSSSDLAQFDQAFGLADPPSFTKYNQLGQTTNLPGTDPAGAGNLSGNWEVEEALDIEWAHAIAPGASIDLVEANTDTNNDDLFTAVATAAKLPGVSVISMSWGIPEGQSSGDVTASEEATYDTAALTTPSGHQGVTFVAATGDQGSPGYYPAYSPKVLAVGGTTLNLNPDNTFQSETAWSGSGGGTGLYEGEPAYQEAVQSTGKRTIPDVAFNADPNTGVAVYDSYDNTDNSGPWLEIGGTSVASPSWAGLIAIVNQGRVNAHGATLDGPTETLPALYAVSPGDFHDITSGSNGGFKAGPGYDEVTGLGTPSADRLAPDLLAYGTATQLAITDQPPSKVIAGDTFGVVVSATDAQGTVDPEFSGTMTLSLATAPAGVSFSPVTVTASHGQAVFDGLTLNNPGAGYAFQVTSSGFPAIGTNTFEVIANPTPGSGTFFPVGTDSSLRAAFSAADSNAYASNTIMLSAGTYVLTDPTAGAVVIQNTSSLPSKTLTIVGAGETSTVIQPGFYPWQDRIFEIVSPSVTSLVVVFQDLAIEGGNATNGGILGGSVALGGGLLIDGGAVRMTHVAVSNNQAEGARGSNGPSGAAGVAGQNGGDGGDGRGGGIYLATGTLALNDDLISNNIARGGAGGSGGDAGNQHAVKSGAAKAGAVGGDGGGGGTASGGGVYVAGGSLQVAGGTFASNRAGGGAGGKGGKGGDGILGKPGGIGGNGGAAGPAAGGAIYLAQGSLTLDLSTFQANSAVGGQGGAGGAGGPGSSLLVSTSLSISLSGGSIFGSNTSQLSQLFHGGPGGNGGVGGNGAAGGGGGVYVGGGTLTLFDVTLDKNQAIGGQGGTGGQGGQAGLGSLSGILSGHGTVPAAGSGGSGGQGGSGSGGGLYLAGGTVTLFGDTLSANAAQGGAGGTGGIGGSGALAGGLSGLAMGLTGGLEPGHHQAGGRRGGTGVGDGAIPLTSGSPTITGGGGASGGPGGDGGDGGQGKGGGLYVAGGALTLLNSTVAENSVQAGASGSGGAGGNGGSNGLGDGAPGQPGQPGSADGGAFYITAGTVSLFNSTVALNKQTGTGSGGGVVQVNGTVTAVSTLFAGNGTVNYSGKITASYSLFQTAPSIETITGTHNLTGVDPKLAAAGLFNNGGPTLTIDLQAGSLAIGAGANPENLATDQRGYAPRTGPGGTDIGAVQYDGTTDTTSPTATLSAPSVTTSNAATLNPYRFTITYQDDTAVLASSLAGAVVQVLPPGGGAAITATVVSTQAVGTPDPLGNAQAFVVTYQITPPGNSWSAADNGAYTITLGGSPVTDLVGNPVATGTLGSFSVRIGSVELIITSQPTSPVTAGSTFSVSVSVEDTLGQVQTGFNSDVTIALASYPAGAQLGGTLTVPANKGMVTFSDLFLDTAGQGYTLQLTASGLPIATSAPFDVIPTTPSQLVVTKQPPGSVTAGQLLSFGVTVEDRFLNVETTFGASVTVGLGSNPGTGTLGGTVFTVTPSKGVATFSGLYLTMVGKGYTLKATASGLTSAISDPINVTPGTTSQLVAIAQPPGTVTAGNPFGFTVWAEDGYGNLATSFGGGVTVALKKNPGGATLGGTLTVPANKGVIAFPDLTMNLAAHGYTLQATSNGLTAVTSALFNVIAAAPSQLVVIAQPPKNVFVNQPFSFSVTEEDRFGNVETTFNGSVTAALGTNPSGGTLGGTLIVMAQSGVATFNGLTLNRPGTGYTLKATTSGLPAVTSNPFNVKVRPGGGTPSPGVGAAPSPGSGASSGLAGSGVAAGTHRNHKSLKVVRKGHRPHGHILHAARRRSPLGPTTAARLPRLDNRSHPLLQRDLANPDRRGSHKA